MNLHCYTHIYIYIMPSEMTAVKTWLFSTLNQNHHHECGLFSVGFSLSCFFSFCLAFNLVSFDFSTGISEFYLSSVYVSCPMEVSNWDTQFGPLRVFSVAPNDLVLSINVWLRELWMMVFLLLLSWLFLAKCWYFYTPFKIMKSWGCVPLSFCY